MAAKRARQLGLPRTEGAPRRASNPTGHGGKRAGAGRKRALPGPARGKHRARPFHDRRLPVHVVLRVTRQVGRLRRPQAYAAVRAAMIALVGRADFRVVHLSIQRHHIHLLCEADDRRALANGVRARCLPRAGPGSVRLRPAPTRLPPWPVGLLARCGAPSVLGNPSCRARFAAILIGRI